MHGQFVSVYIRGHVQTTWTNEGEGGTLGENELKILVGVKNVTVLK